MYEIYCTLRDSRGLKDSDVAKATGITKSTFQIGKTSQRTQAENDYRWFLCIFRRGGLGENA